MMGALLLSILILALLISMLAYILWRPRNRPASPHDQPIPEFKSIPTEAKVARRLQSSNIKWEI